MPNVETQQSEKVLSVAQNVARVQERIRQAAERVGRDPAEVQLIAASKTVEAARIRAALAAGVKILGENYLQEARKKIGQLGPHSAEWHCIGALQRNKVRYIFDLFSMVHAIDRLSLAEEINRRGERLNRSMQVLLEVNTGGEATKSGFEPQVLLAEVEKFVAMPYVQVRGLMTIPPPTQTPAGARPFYQELRELRVQLQRRGIAGLDFTELSMGMTADFEVAIEEGATMVRVGTAIFGPRPAPQAHGG
jgi:pyridoxal phosphate enzyme (YggS family)